MYRKHIANVKMKYITKLMISKFNFSLLFFDMDILLAIRAARTTNFCIDVIG